MSHVRDLSRAERWRKLQQSLDNNDIAIKAHQPATYMISSKSRPGVWHMVRCSWELFNLQRARALVEGAAVENTA